MRIVGVIPARFGSTRLPGKALKDICGKPMVWWVYQRAARAQGIDEIFVATDDNRILDACNLYGIPAVMTKNTHIEAANRLQEVSEVVKADFYIQINGDEPLIEPDYISSAIPDDIPQDIEFGTNLIKRMHNPVEVMDPSNIKMVCDLNGTALYMSRTPIPYPYRSIEFVYYKHIGIIGYNKKMLDFYANSKPGIYETIEGIATLRFIDYGKKLKCFKVRDSVSLSVDTRMDLDYVIKIVKRKLDAGELDDIKKLL